MRLDGTRRWSPPHVERVIAFERKVARALPDLAASMADASGYSDPERYAEIAPNDGLHALARAAEIAFASDRFELGVEICVELVRAPYARPKTAMQTAQWATIGAILGLIDVQLDATGAYFRPGGMAKSSLRSEAFGITWPDAAQHVRLLAQRLIPAALLTGPFSETVEPLFHRPDGQGQAAAATIQLTEEFIVAASFQGPDHLRAYRGVDIEGLSLERAVRSRRDQAFEALERAYTDRLSAMRRTSMWNILRIRGNLIDWGLLALWIVRLRKGDLTGALGSPQENDVLFIQSLAESFAGWKPDQ